MKSTRNFWAWHCLLALTATLGWAATGLAQQSIQIEAPGDPIAVREDQLPALVYLCQYTPTSKTRVILTWKEGDAWESRDLLSRPYAKAFVLSDARILLLTGESREATDIYVADPTAGKVTPLTKRQYASLIAEEGSLGRLRFGPGRETFHVLRHDIAGKRIELLNYEAAVPDAGPLFVDEARFGTAFAEGLPLRIAPDGRHVAVISSGSDGSYELNVVHAMENKTTGIATGIGTFQDHPAVGFDWIDGETLLYGTVDPAGEASFFQFKIHADEKTPLFALNLPELQGAFGLYHNIDDQAWQITDGLYNDTPYLLFADAQTIVPNPKAGPKLHQVGTLSQVRLGERVIFTGPQALARFNGVQTEDGSHIALALEGKDVPDPEQRMVLFATGGEEEPTQIDKPRYTFEVAGWLTKGPLQP